MELTNHTALITGATAGIGLKSARLLAQEGASVIISGCSHRRGEQAGPTTA
jgi:short-subunit dehydrogenase involved in D-alanine esterification of teichoic acids